MISKDMPTYLQIWEKYHLPESKREHCMLVSKVAVAIAQLYHTRGSQLDVEHLRLAALLHDIDKNIEKLPGESHPDAAVRILLMEGLNDISDLVKKHPLHTILDDQLKPKSDAEKILFLADKMVKFELIGVDERFNLWLKEKNTNETINLLRLSYPKVKELEEEILAKAEITFAELQQLVHHS